MAMTMKLMFIGAGKMATALSGGLIQNNVFAADAVMATDVSPEACRAFEARTGAATTDDNSDAVRSANTVVLAVKPQVAEAVMAPLKGLFAGKLFVSIAAGLALEQLCAWSGSDRVIRVMPNTPAMVGRGAAVFSCAAGVTDADRETATKIFGTVGVVCEMPEEKLDAVTGLSGSGPAYIFELVKAMVDGAKAVGLPPDDALDLTVQTVAGAAEMLRQKMGTPDELRDAVTSPGGTTAAGLQVLKDADFRDLIARVIQRATERSVELGKR